MFAKALLFDLDGVITDTARFHFLAWKELCDKFGFKFDIKDNERLKGVSRRRSLEIILEINNVLNDFSETEKAKMESEKNKCYVNLIKTMTPDDILPGVMSFLEESKRNGLKMAVASASKNAFTVLDCLKLNNYFDYIADATEIKNTKPNPEVFLNCAEALGVSPRECIGIEDAQAGIEAIHAAGMFSVGINVDVTSIEPELNLASTKELNFNVIKKRYMELQQSK